jgi:hypothetical protein
MGQRLVLKTTEGKVTLSDLQAFVETCESYKMVKGTVLEGSGDFTLSVSLPRDQRVISGRRVRVKGKTKQGRAIEDQIEKHKEDKKNGDSEGYVPPAGRKKKAPVRKVKCPICGWRKELVTRGGIKVFKNHTVKGILCAGSGQHAPGQSASKEK